MNIVLTNLGVPPEIQEFFKITELHFAYGNDWEVFGSGYHVVPTTRHLWLAEKETTRELIVTFSVMEALAFLTLNAHRYTKWNSISFVALGNCPQKQQFDWISRHFRTPKITLAFGKGLLGRLTDIKVAAGLRGYEVRFSPAERKVRAEYRGLRYEFCQDAVTLNLFETVTGLRSGIRTRKPKIHDTFLDQLKYDAEE